MKRESYAFPEEKAKELMLEAFRMAQYSTCARRRVGAIIANRQGEIISGGFNHFSNGISCEAKFFYEYSRDVYPETEEYKMFVQMLAQAPHKAHELEKDLSPELSAVWKSFLVFTKTDEFKALHKEWQNTEIHSELTAILAAFKLGESTANSVLFSSRSPCIACAHAIIEAGIKCVYYTEISEAGKGGIPILDQAGIETIHLEVEHDYYT